MKGGQGQAWRGMMRGFSKSCQEMLRCLPGSIEQQPWASDILSIRQPAPNTAIICFIDTGLEKCDRYIGFPRDNGAKCTNTLTAQAEAIDFSYILPPHRELLEDEGVIMSIRNQRGSQSPGQRQRTGSDRSTGNCKDVHILPAAGFLSQEEQ